MLVIAWGHVADSNLKLYNKIYSWSQTLKGYLGNNVCYIYNRMSLSDIQGSQNMKTTKFKPGVLLLWDYFFY